MGNESLVLRGVQHARPTAKSATLTEKIDEKRGSSSGDVASGGMGSESNQSQASSGGLPPSYESVVGSSDGQTASDSPIFDDLWTEAYNTMGKDTANAKLLERFEQYIKEGRDSALDEGAPGAEGASQRERLSAIQRAAKQRLDKVANAHLSLSIAGKTIVVREVFRKVIETVLAFKETIGSAVSANPCAALAWTGVMAMLPLLENSLQQDELAAGGLNEIVFLLVRYQHVQKDFLSQFRYRSQSKETHRLLWTIRAKLVNIYVQVYLYEIRFILQYSKGKAHRLLRNAVAADGWSDMLAVIKSTSQEVDQALQDLDSSIVLKSLGIVKDQLNELEALQQATLSSVKLPSAANAQFDSEAVLRSEAKCLKSTRQQVLRAIQEWATDPTGEPIFWLYGMAGTGKTSVVLTVADALSQQRPFTNHNCLPPLGTCLGASFFFKQGDATRNSIRIVFSTIAKTLAHRFTDLKVHIAEAIRRDLDIGAKGPSKQFDDLILQPLTMLDQYTLVPMRLVVVIDALDECVNQTEGKEFIATLAALKTLRLVQLRVLISSRPDDYIVESFKKLDSSLYRSLNLTKVDFFIKDAQDMDDITWYLRHTLSAIATEQNIPQTWVDEESITKLSKKADGLFIYAATACRFLNVVDIQDEISRQELLDLIFSDDVNEGGAPQQKVDEIYLKVLSFPHLRNARVGTRLRFFESIKNILGFIAVFFEPVSISTLSAFLKLERQELDKKLHFLHSILDIPSDESSPISLVHLSFRDFFLSEERSGSLPFRVEESKMHRAVLERCIGLMSKGLHQDMCNLVLPGYLISDIAPDRVETCISRPLQYACRYWIEHLGKLSSDECREAGLKDDGEIHRFLRDSLLFWIETMGLIRETATAALALSLLDSLINTQNSLSSFMTLDASFTLTRGSSSMLLFSSTALLFSSVQ
ncbi:hypothetical protein VTH82DRAFT_6995 [Thermothelomyces myriococcoides]